MLPKSTPNHPKIDQKWYLGPPWALKGPIQKIERDQELIFYDFSDLGALFGLPFSTLFVTFCPQVSLGTPPGRGPLQILSFFVENMFSKVFGISPGWANVAAVQ